jgi:hypothetical protein
MELEVELPPFARMNPAPDRELAVNKILPPAPPTIEVPPLALTVPVKDIVPVATR